MSAKSTPRPMIDVWYKTSQGDMFEVITVDEQEDAIEIQYLDGSLEELDDDAWSSLAPKEIDPPREAVDGAYDDAEEGEDFDDEADHDQPPEWDSGGFDD